MQFCNTVFGWTHKNGANDIMFENSYICVSILKIPTNYNFPSFKCQQSDVVVFLFYLIKDRQK